jgi:hypothetical protein
MTEIAALSMAGEPNKARMPRENKAVQKRDRFIVASGVSWTKIYLKNYFA